MHIALFYVIIKATLQLRLTNMNKALVVSDNSIPHRDEVVELLCSCWAPSRILRYLSFRYGPISLPTLQQVAQLRSSLPTDDIRPLTRLEELTGNIRVDVESKLHQILRLQEERVGNALLLEEVARVTLELTSDMISQYWKMLKEASTFLQSTGEVPKVRSKGGDEEFDAAPAVVQQTVILLKDLVPHPVLLEQQTAQALQNPHILAREAGIIEGDYEEVNARAAGVSTEHSA